jgi:hypothetical protein
VNLNDICARGVSGSMVKRKGKCMKKMRNRKIYKKENIMIMMIRMMVKKVVKN